MSSMGSSFGGGGGGASIEALGGAVQDIFGGLGDFAEGKGYQKAAGYATANANITKRSTQIQEMQANREIFQANSTTQSGIAGSGQTNAGSGQYLLRSNAQQAGLTKALIANQGLINEQGYQAEAAADSAMATAAQMSGEGATAGGLLQGIGAVFSMF